MPWSRFSSNLTGPAGGDLTGQFPNPTVASGSITSGKLAQGASSISLVSALPSSPVDGQVIYYQSTTSGTGGGISGTYTSTMQSVGAIWQLRYNASSASSYKWEFVGGSSTLSTLNDYGQAISRSNGGGWGDATSGHVSPTLVVPLAGDYRIDLSVQHIRHAVSDGAASIGVSINGATPAGPVNLGTTAAGTGNSPAGSTTIQGYQNGLSANSTLKIQYSASGSSSIAVYNGPLMTLTPVRVG